MMNMRLREKDRTVIRDAVAETFGPNAVVRLFGSRTRDDLKGGDIDLHIETDPLPRTGFPSPRSRLWALLQMRLGEQKIDLVVTERGREPSAIERIAYREGLLV